MKLVETLHRIALLAEDEPMLAEAFCWALEDAGFEVLKAESGDAAIPLLIATHVDILVTDIRMPGTLDGWALLKRAREFQPDLPVVLVSGYSPDHPRLPSRSAFLQKPFAPETLVSAIERII